MKRRTFGALTAAVLTVPLAFATSTADAADPGGPGCPTTSEVRDGLVQGELPEGTDVVACDLVGIVVSAAPSEGGVEIPPAGFMVGRFAFGESESDDGSENLIVNVAPDGALSYDGGTSSDAPGAPSACDDDWYKLVGGPLDQATEPYWIKLSTIPSGMDMNETRSSITAGVGAWTQQDNDCGLADQVTQGVSYQGDTTADSSVSPDGNCRQTGYDTASVWTFGPISTATPGLTCRYGGGAFGWQAADTKLNTNYAWTNFGASSGCSGKIDVQSIATHEAGHLWGLDDISASQHPNLTMRGGGLSAVECNTKLRSLGKGDVLGMRDLY